MKVFRRSLFAWIALLGPIFSQLAVSAYACPLQNPTGAPAQMESKDNMAGMPCAEMGMAVNVEQPALRAQHCAQGNAPALSAAADGVQAARDMAVAAGQLPDSVLRLGVDNLPVNGADRWSLGRDFMTMRRMGLMQEYVSADKRQVLRRRGELDAVRQDAARHSLATTLRRDVATAWFDHYYALKSRALLKPLEAEVELQLRSVDAQLRAGKASATESPMATAMLLQTRDRILLVDKQQRLAQTALARWLGQDAAREPAAAPNIEALALDLANPDVVTSAPLGPGACERARGRPGGPRHRRVEQTAQLELGDRLQPARQCLLQHAFLRYQHPLPLNASNKQDRDIAAKQAQVACRQRRPRNCCNRRTG